LEKGPLALLPKKMPLSPPTTATRIAEQACVSAVMLIEKAWRPPAAEEGGERFNLL